MISLTLTGEPLSTQHIYRYACRGNHPAMYMTAAGKTRKEQYQWEARSQYRGKPFTGRLSVTLALHFGTKRRKDADNYCKLVLDALTGVVWVDDEQIDELKIVKKYDRERPRVVIEVI